MPNFDATKNEAIRQANKMANKAAMGLFMEDNLARAMIQVHADDKPKTDKSVPLQFEFLFNPSEIEMNRGLTYKQQDTQAKAGETGGGKSQEFTGESARTLSIGELTFDTFFDKSGKKGSRASVRTKYIQPLEKLMRAFEVGTDGAVRPPRVLFVWGSFMNDKDEFNGNGWYIEKMNTRYTMFLEDGTPVRAKVKLDLIEAAKEAKTEDNQELSSDAMITVTVGEWETAFGAVRNAGGKLKHVLKICMMNGIDDPLFCGGKTLTWNPKDFT